MHIFKDDGTLQVAILLIELIAYESKQNRNKKATLKIKMYVT